METGYPGGLSELEFVEAYWNSTLRKPQVVADAALRALVMAGTGDRVLVVVAIAEQAVEAARRLVAVFRALDDRRYLVAKSLLQPLPGEAEWTEFLQRTGSISPEQVVRVLSLGDDALAAANRLRAQPDLAFLTPLIGAAARGEAVLAVAPNSIWEAAVSFIVPGDGGGEGTAIAADEAAGASLADVTADLSTIARGMLGSYLNSRRTAGQRV